LIVHFYPIEQQESVAAKRENGKKGGRPKKIKQAETLTQQGDKPCGYGLVNHEGNHMGNLDITLKERKEKKSNVRTTTTNEQFTPPTLEEFTNYLQVSLPKINPEWTPERITRASQLQHETYTDQDWHTGGDRPRKIKNWQTTTRNSMKYQKPWNFGQSQQQFTAPSRDLTKPTMS
jgi:hypothetical protein